MNTETNATVDAATAESRPAEAKRRPARAPKKARRATSKAASRKVRAKAGSKRRTTNKAAGDGLGRPDTLARYICERIMKGQSNEEISKAAAKAYPKAASTTPKHVAWARWDLKRRGVKNVPESK
jgi:hypothetical protein